MNQTVIAPTTLVAISEALRETSGPVYGKTALGHPFAIPLAPEPSATLVSLESYTGIIEHDVSDQVVVVRAGTTILELQEALGKHGQCLPLPMLSLAEADAGAACYGALADEIGFNLPHALHAQCGTWRDWIIGMTVVQADGTIAKCGSKAVKNVAGYDVQKLMIGARGSLGLICEVIFKTFPLHALPRLTATIGTGCADLAHRTLRTDFAAAVAFYGDRITAIDEASSTLWAQVGDGEALKLKEGWVLRAGAAPQFDETQTKFMKRAKEIFDPSGRLNPGALGIL